MELLKYNPVDVQAALERGEFSPFPRVSDRSAWAEVARAVGPDVVQQLVSDAERLAAQDVPALPATLYLEFQRTGQREGYQEPSGVRRQMLATMALAECLEDKGRFLDPLLDVVWAICEESSWAMPAHQGELADMDRPVIDLGAAGVGLALAEFDHLLAERMDPLVGKRIRYEVDRRLTTPYLGRHDFWWMYNTQFRTVNNWTAVCTGGVVGAALYLEPDKARLAEIICRGARSLHDYLDTFDEDGGSSEGPGYWGYGFGHYVLLAQLVEAATGGTVSLLEGERIRKIAQFPLRTMLTPGAFANFSDCDAEVHYPTSLLVYLAQRLDLPGLMQLAREQPEGGRGGQLPWALRNLLWRVEPEPPGRFVPAKRDWFSGMMWMFARHNPDDPDALVLAAKGGHNGEMHNQNDVGSLIVRYRQESLIAELGRGRYTKAYFGPQRYEHLVNSSLGHSTPVPNGKAQLPGKEHGATLVERRADDSVDAMTIEMRGAYPPEADLGSLRRTVALHRDTPEGWVELEDVAVFSSGPGMLESALLTFSDVETTEGQVTITGQRGRLRVTYDASRIVTRVDVHEGLDLSTGPTDARRIVFALREPQKEGTIALRIEPMAL